MDTIESLQQQNKQLQAELDKYKSDPRNEAFLVYKKIIYDQVQFLKDFKIKDEIQKTTKEDATYARAQSMWKELPDMIREMGLLRTELKIDTKEEEKLTMSTPQSIARGNV